VLRENFMIISAATKRENVLLGGCCSHLDGAVFGVESASEEFSSDHFAGLHVLEMSFACLVLQAFFTVLLVLEHFLRALLLTKAFPGLLFLSLRLLEDFMDGLHLFLFHLLAFDDILANLFDKVSDDLFEILVGFLPALLHVGTALLVAFSVHGFPKITVLGSLLLGGLGLLATLLLVVGGLLASLLLVGLGLLNSLLGLLGDLLHFFSGHFGFLFGLLCLLKSLTSFYSELSLLSFFSGLLLSFSFLFGILDQLMIGFREAKDVEIRRIFVRK
jgi:hypothetical protein